MKLTVEFQTTTNWHDLIQILRDGAVGRAKKSDKGEIYYEEANFSPWAKKIVRQSWK